MARVKKINKKDLARLLDQWSQEFTVLVPSKETGTEMAVWQGQDTGFLVWYRNTVIPPKVGILPLMEKMFSFTRDGDGYKLELPPPDNKKQLIFGIRPCDARALKILDMTFGDAYQDAYYQGRRQNTLLVGMVCDSPYDSCFCTALGGSPSDTSGVDLMLTDTGDELVIEAVTQAGQELLDRTGSLSPATGDDEARARDRQEAACQKVTRKIDLADIEDKLLARFDDQEFWQKVSAKCVSCGVCTLLCPTCYCFDINDEMQDKRGSRFRSLDSCSFVTYTKMPMENPRAEKWRRVRNRVCHKYEFYPRLFGTIACTGCGRCIRLCPVNWDITRTLESVTAET